MASGAVPMKGANKRTRVVRVATRQFRQIMHELVRDRNAIDRADRAVHRDEVRQLRGDIMAGTGPLENDERMMQGMGRGRGSKRATRPPPSSALGTTTTIETAEPVPSVVTVSVDEDPGSDRDAVPVAVDASVTDGERPNSDGVVASDDEEEHCVLYEVKYPPEYWASRVRRQGRYEYIFL